ncbi:MAG: hypothetical protein ACR2HJ_01210 [Fimbriimonadales bacterium]
MQQLTNTQGSELKRSRGQTLVIVLIILFVLVTLGFVVVLVVGRELGSTGIARERNVSNDLAQAGVRYAYSQLRFSEDGADWRPQPPLPVPADVDPTRPPGLGPNSDPENPTATNPDPDYFWLRRQRDPIANNPLDKGGPDGLGAYTRLNYQDGRSLARVRYSPSGQEMFEQGGAINNRGKLRAYTIIDVAGRPGAFNSLDPTSTKEPNNQNVRELTAIVPIGIIESAWYVTNKDERNQPVDIGNPVDFGANYLGNTVRVKRVLGGDPAPSPGGIIRTLGAPLYFNADVLAHGNVQDRNGASGLDVYLNAELGDQISITGSLTFQESTTPLRIFRAAGTALTPFFPVPSADATFSTFRGVLRDGREQADPSGFPRLAQRKEPPIIDEDDPNTNRMRYRLATRDSGSVGPGGFNIGRLGFGRGVYVGNRGDLNRDSEDGSYSQRYDWLNPNKHPDGFWQGPYYIPPAAHISLKPDGFEITRNLKNNRDTWRNYSGGDAARHSLRFKLGFGSGPTDLRIINELTPGITSFGNPTQGDFLLGMAFNGIIFAEGNIRIRGVIPALSSGLTVRGVQLTIVSLGTGYIEGSIIKGAPTSSLALLCRDNVALNTSQFVGSALTNTLQVVRDNTDPTSPARLKVDAGHNFDALIQFPVDPLTGQPFVTSYTFNNPNSGGGNPVNTSIFMAHAADFDRNTFINLLLNPGRGATPEFMFENMNPPNAASQFFPPGPTIPTYGLADPAFQVLPVYEKRRFEIFPLSGAYQLFGGGTDNVFRFKTDNTIAVPGRGDYFFSRLAVQPLDVRIEAAVYAQEGSFFVIPGPWANPNPNDRRDSFTNASDRFTTYQAAAEYPFYGEPVDVRITVVGSVSENFPPVMADQSAWLRNWGWIPAEYGESGQYVPDQHFPRIPGSTQPDFSNSRYVPNLYINYDPVLVSGRVGGSFDPAAAIIRTDTYGRPLPPMPKLPVGTKLLYFGEVNP